MDRAEEVEANTRGGRQQALLSDRLKMWVPALLSAGCWEHVHVMKLLQVLRTGGFVGAKSVRLSLTWETMRYGSCG